MKKRTWLTLSSLGILSCVLTAQEADFPGASDFRTLTRPANSLILGAMHIDNDEYAVPLGPVERNAKAPAKSLTVTGAIDMVAYGGPKTASSLTTFGELTSQLKTQGYTEVWTCARATCGSAFTLANILDKPLIDSIHQGDWGHYLIDDLNATNDDIRYGTYRKGEEYMLVMAALAPGYPSGALVIRVNGPANDPVLRLQGDTASTNSNGTNAASTTNAGSNSNARGQKIRSAAHSLWNKIPQ